MILSVRPERLVINPGIVTLANCFEACVEQVIYQGDQIRVQVRLTRGPTLFLHIPNNSRPHGLRPGDNVRVGWSVADCRAYAIGEAPPLGAAPVQLEPAMTRRVQ